jgi:hypothetical protein
VWNICRGNCSRLPPKSLLQILLILAGDVELCPGPRMRCGDCKKCFRRNADKVSCTTCNNVFHLRCLCNDICRTCLTNGGSEIHPEEYRLPELERLSNTRGFKILHQNIRGLFGKKDIVSQILATNIINIFCVSETFITSDTPACCVNITGYSYEKKCRLKGSGGGIGVYIKDGTPYTRRSDLENENI